MTAGGNNLKHTYWRCRRGLRSPVDSLCDTPLSLGYSHHLHSCHKSAHSSCQTCQGHTLQSTTKTISVRWGATNISVMCNTAAQLQEPDHLLFHSLLYEESTTLNHYSMLLVKRNSLCLCLQCTSQDIWFTMFYTILLNIYSLFFFFWYTHTHTHTYTHTNMQL